MYVTGVPGNDSTTAAMPAGVRFKAASLEGPGYHTAPYRFIAASAACPVAAIYTRNTLKTTTFTAMSGFSDGSSSSGGWNPDMETPPKNKRGRAGDNQSKLMLPIPEEAPPPPERYSMARDPEATVNYDPRVVEDDIVEILDTLDRARKYDPAIMSLEPLKMPRTYEAQRNEPYLTVLLELIGRKLRDDFIEVTISTNADDYKSFLDMPRGNHQEIAKALLMSGLVFVTHSEPPVQGDSPRTKRARGRTGTYVITRGFADMAV